MVIVAGALDVGVPPAPGAGAEAAGAGAAEVDGDVEAGAGTGAAVMRNLQANAAKRVSVPLPGASLPRSCSAIHAIGNPLAFATKTAATSPGPSGSTKRKIEKGH